MLTGPHGWRDFIITLFATLSSATFLAADRGNADLILRVLAAYTSATAGLLAGICATARRFRSARVSPSCCPPWRYLSSACSTRCRTRSA